MKNQDCQDYIIINNCPRCRGALLNYLTISRKKVIQCLQCGATFEEIKKNGNGNGAVMYVKPLVRFRR